MHHWCNALADLDSDSGSHPKTIFLELPVQAWFKLWQRPAAQRCGRLLVAASRRQCASAAARLLTRPATLATRGAKFWALWPLRGSLRPLLRRCVHRSMQRVILEVAGVLSAAARTMPFVATAHGMQGLSGIWQAHQASCGIGSALGEALGTLAASKKAQERSLR